MLNLANILLYSLARSAVPASFRLRSGLVSLGFCPRSALYVSKKCSCCGHGLAQQYAFPNSLET